MTYILSGVAVKIPERAERPRQPGRPSPHDVVDSPLMGKRFLRPRGSGYTSTAAADKFMAQVTALKGQQAGLEKLLAQMVAELKKVSAACVALPDSAARNTCGARKVALEKAIDLCMSQIKDLAGKANKAADSAIKVGASKNEVVAAASSVTPESGNTVVVESSTMGVAPSGQIVPGPGAAVATTPVITDPGAAAAAPGGNPAVNAAINVSEAHIPWGKIALGLGGIWLVKKFVKA